MWRENAKNREVEQYCLEIDKSRYFELIIYYCGLAVYQGEDTLSKIIK